MKPKFSGLWRHSDFLKLWFGQTVSEFGSHITGSGLGILAITVLAATPGELGILAALSSIPILVFGLVAGVWVDRLPRRPIMIFTDAARLLLVLAVPLAAFTGHLSMELLYIITPALALLTLVFNTAYRAYLPSLVERNHLLEGNTKLAMTSSLAEIGGPSITGVLIQIMTAPVAIFFDSLSYLVSVISLLLIRKPEPSPAPDAGGTSMLHEARAGFAVIFDHPVLRTLVIGISAREFFGNFFAALYSFYVIQELGLSVVVLGVLVSAGGIGALVGAALAERVTRRFGLGRTITWTRIISASLGVLTVLAGGPPLLAAAMLLANQLFGDALGMIYEIDEMTVRQTLVPHHLLGRANASAGFLAQGVAPIGALAAGAIAAATSARFALGIAIFGFLVVALWTATTPVRRFEFQAAEN
jgi:Na+/melibiose symporter-like transporter